MISRYFIPLLLGLALTLLFFLYNYFFASLFVENGWLHNWLSGLIIYLVVVIILISGQKWKKLKSTKSENVQKEINQFHRVSSLNQLNPHFMFNSLNTISSLIVQNNSQDAYQAIIILTKLMRYLLENSDRISCTIVEEMNFVNNYLEIETIRFNNNFDFNIHIDSSVNQELLVPKMIIQLHVENAVKHGLIPKKEGHGKLNININQINNTTMIVITDNGIGRDASKSLQHDLSSTGRGIQISEQLIILYNKLHQPKVNQSFTDILDQQGNPAGTEVKISVIS
ncbi:MAG: sensor histidine kinase [Cyclobacteriaceae bacterium]